MNRALSPTKEAYCVSRSIFGFAEALYEEAYLSMRRVKQRRKTQKLVGLSGLEPPTSPLSGVRSNQLSYRPIFSALFDSVESKIPRANRIDLSMGAASYFA